MPKGKKAQPPPALRGITPSAAPAIAVVQVLPIPNNGATVERAKQQSSCWSANKVEDMSLWVGSHADAINKEELAKRGIGAIVNVAEECDDVAGTVRTTPQQLTFREDMGVTVLRLDLADHCDALALPQFLPTAEWVAAALEKGMGVLIHCRSGVSRGPTFALATLMLLKGLSADAALETVRKVRPHVNPNLGFTIALQDFERTTQEFCEFASQCCKQIADVSKSALLHCYRSHIGNLADAYRAVMEGQIDFNSSGASPPEFIMMGRVFSVESEGGLTDSSLSTTVSAAPSPNDFWAKTIPQYTDCHFEAAFAQRNTDAADTFCAVPPPREATVGA